jgi:hypothetical protein
VDKGPEVALGVREERESFEYLFDIAGIPSWALKMVAHGMEVGLRGNLRAQIKPGGDFY